MSHKIKVPKGLLPVTPNTRVPLGTVLYIPSDRHLIQLVRINHDVVQFVFIETGPVKRLWSSAFRQVSVGSEDTYLYKMGDLYSESQAYAGYPMYVVKLDYLGGMEFVPPQDTTEYLRSGALFVGTYRDVTELFRLSQKNPADTRGVHALFILTRLSDNAVRSFYIPDSISTDRDFTEYVTSHSDEYQYYTFNRITDIKNDTAYTEV